MRIHLNRLEGWEELEPERLGPLLRRAARLALETGKLEGPTEGGDGPEVSITCLGTREMGALNREYLGRRGPTDVIAFQLGEQGTVLGDVYVCPEMALERGEPGREMVRLVVHGVLHVLGHEHPEDESRWDSPMFRLQEELVERVMEGRARSP